MWVSAVSVALIAAILVIDGSLFAPSLATSPPAAAPTLLGYAGAAQPGELLTRVYPLPRTAWVNVEGLNVRNGPSLDNEPLTKLAYGYSVTVDDYSADGAWSHINGANVGWVNNQYLNFVAEAGIENAAQPTAAQPAVQLGVEQLAVAAPAATVYTGPGLTFPVATTLPAATTVTAVAATLDGQWRHLALPAAGWVPAADLAP
jgi:uncharacterized protein YgiM (DUF1202 family)